ncbi:MAG: hypothetical protein OEW15_12900 [Nitrospirota bacterium]|nr:hypothetical protein [Nitrospirota bacterium]
MEKRRRKTDEKASGSSFCRFGCVAVRRGFVTIDQLKQALAEQVDGNILDRGHRLVGSILFEKGWISEQERERVLLDLHRPPEMDENS